jgi:hypothetical protein
MLPLHYVLKLVGRCGIDPPPIKEEIYSLSTEAISFTYP